MAGAARRWLWIAALGATVATSCGGTSEDTSKLIPADNPILANFTTELDWWLLCDELAERDQDTSELRRELIDAPFNETIPYDADDVDDFLGITTDRCATYRDSRDAAKVIGALTLDDMQTACKHRSEAGSADFYISHINDTFGEFVGNEIDGLIQEACRDYQPPEEDAPEQPPEEDAPESTVADDDEAKSTGPTVSTQPAAEVAPDVEALRTWLSANWHDVNDGWTVTTPMASQCFEIVTTTGLDRFVKCIYMPANTLLEPVCTASSELASSLGTAGRSAWISASAALKNAVDELAFTAATTTFVEPEGAVEFGIYTTDSVELLVDEAEFLSQAVQDGTEPSGPMAERKEYVASMFDAVCGERIYLPPVVDLISQTEQRYVDAVGDDPLFRHLPIGQGQSGDHVLQLQQALVRIGLDIGQSGADGHFGPATASAIGQMRYDNHIVGDEVLDIDALEVLRASIPPDVVRSDQADCPTPAEVQEYLGSTVRELPEGSVTVSELQCILLPSWTRPLIAKVTTPDSVGYSFITESHTAWYEQARAATRAELCMVVPDKLMPHVESEVQPFVEALGC